MALKEKLEQIRWKGVRKQQNYKYKGPIPPNPKTIDYYIPYWEWEDYLFLQKNIAELVKNR